MFKSLIRPEIRSDLAGLHWLVWALCMLPVLLASTPAFTAMAARGMA